MVKLGHSSIEVLQNDVAAKEHADTLTEKSLDVETRYIEVSEGVSFAIRLTVDEHFKFEEYDRLSIEVCVDGQYAGGICYQQNELVAGRENVQLIEGFTHVIDGKTTLRTFRFEEAEMSMVLWRCSRLC